MCWLFHGPVEKKMCMPHEESSKYAWEPRNGDSGRLGNRTAIFLVEKIAQWRHNCP